MSVSGTPTPKVSAATYRKRRAAALGGLLIVVIATVVACNSLLDGEPVAGVATGGGTAAPAQATSTAPEATTTAPPTTEPTTTTTTTTTVPAVPSAGTWPGPGQAAITFDDGPDPTWTPQILDILDARSVPATFFLLGTSVDRFPDLARTIATRGHSVQNHTWNHPYLTGLGDEAVLSELALAQAAIEQAVGTAPSCVRPPYGASDARVDQLAASMGLAMVRWNVDPSDYRQPPPEQMVANVAGAADAAAGGPLVVLLHDGGGNRQQTVNALPGIIDALAARGYTFVPMC